MRVLVLSKTTASLVVTRIYRLHFDILILTSEHGSLMGLEGAGWVTPNELETLLACTEGCELKTGASGYR